MEHYEKQNFVSIWAGNMDSRTAFEAFFEERIEEDSSIEDPINDFAASIGIGYYDHDFQEAKFGEQGATTLRQMLQKSSFSTSYIDQAEAAANQMNLGNVNTVAIIFDFLYTGTATGNAPLMFVGAFPYDKNAQ